MRLVWLCLLVLVFTGFAIAEPTSLPEFEVQSALADEDPGLSGVMKMRTSIRQKADVKSERIRKAQKGEKVDVLERTEKGRWLKLRFEDGTEGWVAAGLVMIVQQEKKQSAPTAAVAPVVTPAVVADSPPPQKTPPAEKVSSKAQAADDAGPLGVMTSRTSVRKKAKLKSKKIRKVNKGEKGKVLGRTKSGRWLKLHFEDGTKGWVSARLVKLVKKEEKSAPIVAPIVAPVVAPVAAPAPVAEPAVAEAVPPPEEAQAAVQAVETSTQEEVAAAPEEKVEEKAEEQVVEQVEEKALAEPQPAGDQPEDAEDKERVLVALDVTTDQKELDAQTLRYINNRITGVLRKESGSSLVTQKEMVKWLQFGKDSEGLNCDENKQCMVDISSKVNGDLLFGGKIGKVGDVWTINVYLMDARKSETIGRASGEAPNLTELEEVAAKVTKEIISEMSGLKKGMTVSLEELGERPKIAVMDFNASGVEKDLAKNISDIVTVELKQFKGFQIISSQEIMAMINFETVKQGVGCEDDSCFAEIGNALGVGFLVSGGVGLVEETYIINIKVINIRQAKIVGREQELFVGPADGLLPAARFAVRRVFGSPYTGEGLMKLSIAEEEAEVIIDGESVGLTPELKLPDAFPVGKYRLEVNKKNFFPLARDVYIEPARQTNLQLALIEEPPEWWETWWFWTTVGVVVAGAITTGVVLGTMDSSGADPNANGTAGVTGN